MKTSATSSKTATSLSLLWATLASLSAAVCVAWAGGASVMFNGSGWLGRAVQSPIFITMAAVTFVCAVVLGAIIVVLLHAGRAQGRMGRQEGSAILEFALVMPIALMIVLVMTQSSLLLGGNICVNYAAFCAARSAVVQIPTETDSEPRNIVQAHEGGAKMRAIENAALWAIFPISSSSPSAPQADVTELQNGVQDFFEAYGRTQLGNMMRSWPNRMGYARNYTRVWIAPPANGSSYDPGEDIVAHVNHKFYLSVPYASKVFRSLADGGVDLPFGAGEYGAEIYATCTLTNEGQQDYIVREVFPRAR
ncbi:MAG: hypothetical protein GXY38_01455 [Planctomycetes bacterium]|nr:hypothetical protein [Planctomycetota bacterium]